MRQYPLSKCGILAGGGINSSKEDHVAFLLGPFNHLLVKSKSSVIAIGGIAGGIAELGKRGGTRGGHAVGDEGGRGGVYGLDGEWHDSCWTTDGAKIWRYLRVEVETDGNSFFIQRLFLKFTMLQD